MVKREKAMKWSLGFKYINYLGKDCQPIMRKVDKVVLCTDDGKDNIFSTMHPPNMSLEKAIELHEKLRSEAF